MGDSWNYSDKDALPVHLVDIDSFYITRYEITISQYKQYAKTVGVKLPSEFPLDKPGDYPAVEITWQEAIDYCNCFGYRLPTEEEWEYVATGGNKRQLYAGTNDPMEVDKYSVNLYNSDDSSAPVGSKLPNRFGVYDLSGNVDEWIGDFYPDYANKKMADLSLNKLRIIRGGSFILSPIRNYTRTGVMYDQRSRRIGFRCVQSF